MSAAGRRILVTGGASFIGSHCVDALLASGAREVRLLDNLSMGSLDNVREALERPGVSLLRGDVRSDADVEAALADVDAVVHAAAVITEGMAADPRAGFEVNVLGTQTLLTACAAAGVEKVVLISSVSVYGRTDGTDIDEETPFRLSGFGWPSTLYGASKAAAEALCRAAEQRHGLRFLALRCPSVYGPRQHHRGVNTALLADAYREFRSGRAPLVAASPDEAHDYVYVGDVAEAVVRALSPDVHGEAINVASGRSTRVAEAVERLRAISGHPEPARYGPRRSAIQIVSGSSLSYRVEKARRLLGWEPRTTLAEGLGRLAAWLDGQSESRPAGPRR
jgi:UDP-glucose 4-epimerase